MAAITQYLEVVVYKEQTTARYVGVAVTATPTYLSELVETHAPPRALHPFDAPILVVPRIHTELACCTFSVAAPSTWNILPADNRLCDNILTFKRHLKPIYSNSISPLVLHQVPLHLWI